MSQRGVAKSNGIVKVRIEVTEDKLLEALAKIGETGVLHPRRVPREALKGKRGEMINWAIEVLGRLCDNARRVLASARAAGLIPEEDEHGLPEPRGSLERYIKTVEREVERWGASVESAVEVVQELRSAAERAAANAALAGLVRYLGRNVSEILETKNFVFKVYLVHEEDEEEVFLSLESAGLPFAYTSLDGFKLFTIAVPKGEEALLARVMSLFNVRELSLEEGPIVNYPEESLSKLLTSVGGSIRSLKSLAKLEALTQGLEGLRELLLAVKVEGKRYVIEGYVSRDGLGELKKALPDSTVELIELPPERDAPVVKKYGRVIGAFEVILGMYGVPSREEVDPTPILAVTFPLFFGFMFGDIGQGAVLALAGAYLLSRSEYKNWGVVLLMCGAWSILFGALYGEFFGYSFHELFHVHAPLSLHGEEGINAESVKKLLGIAILAGIIHVSLALTMRGVNHLREGHVAEAVTRDFTLVAFYLIGVLLVTSSFLHLIEIDSNLLLYILGGLALIFVIGEPAAHSLRGEIREALSSLFNGIIEMMISVLELVANSLSYARLGVIALVHTALMLIIVSSASAGPMVSIPIQIIGNIGVIMLEGLVAFVQSLRLNFYEFMSKFFSGEGRKYQPIRVLFE